MPNTCLNDIVSLQSLLLLAEAVHSESKLLPSSNEALYFTDGSGFDFDQKLITR
jgi:hypothetical protein